MERLLKEKNMYTNSFNRYFSKIEDNLKSTHPNMMVIQGVFRSLTSTIENLNEVSRKLLDLMLEDETFAENLDETKLEIDELIEKFNILQVTIDIQMKESLSETHSNCTTNISGKRHHLKLPTIEFKKFGGEIKDWLSLWSQFRRILEDNEIEKGDKFNYPLNGTVPKSKARQIIEGYPCSTENYDKVIESFQNRFGKKDILIEFYVRELKLVFNNLQERTKLNVLYDGMSTQIRALKTLDVTTNSYAAILYLLVEPCLSTDLLRVWQRSNLHCSDNNLAIQLDNMKFLKKEVEIEERISLATAGFGLRNATTNRYETQSHNVPPLPTPSALVNGNKRRLCIFCK